MEKLLNWLDKLFSNCIGRHYSGHTKLKEYETDDAFEMKCIKRVSNAIEQTAPIFHLNDDCLLKIISHLSIYDLASVSLACQRLQHLANYQFTLQNKQLAFCDEIVFDYTEVNADERIARVLNIIKAFGGLVDSFTVHDIIYFRILPLIQTQINSLT